MTKTRRQSRLLPSPRLPRALLHRHYRHAVVAAATVFPHRRQTEAAGSLPGARGTRQLPKEVTCVEMAGRAPSSPRFELQERLAKASKAVSEACLRAQTFGLKAAASEAICAPEAAECRILGPLPVLLRPRVSASHDTLPPLPTMSSLSIFGCPSRRARETEACESDHPATSIVSGCARSTSSGTCACGGEEKGEEANYSPEREPIQGPLPSSTIENRVVCRLPARTDFLLGRRRVGRHRGCARETSALLDVLSVSPNRDRSRGPGDLRDSVPEVCSCSIRSSKKASKRSSRFRCRGC